MLNRRLLMAQVGAEHPGGGIVQDGLIFRLDGNSRGSKTGYWADTVSGIEMELINCKEASNHVILPGNGYMHESAAPILKAKKWTAEIVLQADISKAMLISIDSMGAELSPNIGYQDSSLWYTSIRKPGYKALLNDNKIHTLSISEVSAYEDKLTLPSITSDYWGFAAYGITIGARGGGRDKLKGKIYEVRIYNRILTEAEILQNQQYDIDTYFGGVTP